MKNKKTLKTAINSVLSYTKNMCLYDVTKYTSCAIEMVYVDMLDGHGLYGFFKSQRISHFSCRFYFNANLNAQAIIYVLVH